MSRLPLIEEIIDFLSTTTKFILEDLISDTSYGRPEKIEEAFLNEFKMSDDALHFLHPNNVKLPSTMTRDQRLEMLKLNPTGINSLSYPMLIADLECRKSSSDVDDEMKLHASQVTKDEINSIRRFILQRLSINDWNIVAAAYFNTLIELQTDEGKKKKKSI